MSIKSKVLVVVNAPVNAVKCINNTYKECKVEAESSKGIHLFSTGVEIIANQVVDAAINVTAVAFMIGRPFKIVLNINKKKTNMSTIEEVPVVVVS